MIRALWVFLVGPLVTVALAAQIVLADLLGFERALRRYCFRNPRWSARTFLRASGVTVTLEGAEHLAGKGPRILIANHESWFDVFALCHVLPVEQRYVIKKELERVPVWGRAWRSCGHVSVDRRDRQAAVESLDQARKMSGVGDDIHLVVFPEGTRSVDGNLQPFKRGAFVLAIQLAAPVIPVAVIGGRQIMAKGDWRIRRGQMRVVIGEPIPVTALDHSDRGDLACRARDAVVALRGGDGPTEAPVPKSAVA